MFVIFQGLSGAAIPGLAVLRVVRLVRIFRLFKVSKSSATIFLVTMKKSAKPLYMLIFFTSLALTIFSSLMYYAERGSFDEQLETWTRVREYKCELTVTVVESASAIDSQAWLAELEENELSGSACQPLGGPGNATQRNFTCDYQYRYRYEDSGNTTVSDGVDITYEVSKHDCIPMMEVISATPGMPCVFTLLGTVRCVLFVFRLAEHH